MKGLFKNKKILSLMSVLVLGAVVATPLVSPASTSAATAGSLPGITGPVFDLHAVEGRILTPDGNTIYMWGFGAEDPENLGSYKFQYPSPNLIVGEGDSVVINLTNELSVPVSIIFPGQANVMAANVMADESPVQPELNPDGTLASLTTSVAPGGAISYSFDADEPGTYLYESGTDPSLQVQMGLFGMLIIRPSMSDSYAYNDVSTSFSGDNEYLLLFHELDPIIHDAIEDGEDPDLEAYWPRYWTINGRCFPDTLAGDNVPWLPGQPYGSMVVIEPYDLVDNPQPALIRFANAGVHAHPFHTHGNHVKVIGHDGRQSLGPVGEDLSQEHFTLAVGPGQTYEATATWTDVNQWDPETNPIPHLPDMRNLAFTGTWYSGSPYLGEKGDMGVWTVSFNQLGEYYFPWHTHSEREMTNWGGEMGGMMTFLRVNPPGTSSLP